MFMLSFHTEGRFQSNVTVTTVAPGLWLLNFTCSDNDSGLEKKLWESVTAGAALSSLALKV